MLRDDVVRWSNMIGTEIQSRLRHLRWPQEDVDIAELFLALRANFNSIYFPAIPVLLAFALSVIAPLGRAPLQFAGLVDGWMHSLAVRLQAPANPRNSGMQRRRWGVRTKVWQTASYLVLDRWERASTQRKVSIQVPHIENT